MQKKRLLSACLLTVFSMNAHLAFADKGMLAIKTKPGGAKIYINSERKGTSPKERDQSFDIKLEEGQYTITAYEESHSPLWGKMGKNDDVFVGADSRQPIALKLNSFQLNPDLPIAQVNRIKELMTITDNYRSKSSRENDFLPQGNGTIFDKRTGLQWMRCSLGQIWTGETCSGESTKYEWQQAINQAASFAGEKDWRLPTRFELETLVSCSNSEEKGRKSEDKLFALDKCDGEYQRPTTAKEAFPNTEESGYWSSSLDTSKSDAWGIDFRHGDSDDDLKRNSNYVRLVRIVPSE